MIKFNFVSEMLSGAWRGKFSPQDNSTSILDKEARRIVPVPITGNNVKEQHSSLYDIGEHNTDNILFFSIFNKNCINFSVEGFSRPVSPTTHLHQVS